MSEEKPKEETHIEKRRTTALKIVIDGKTRDTEQTRRDFLATLFDFPEYATKEDRVVHHVTRTIRGVEEGFTVYEEMIPILVENDIDITTFKGYREEITQVYNKKTWDLDVKVKEVTGISDKTYLHYKFSSSYENNGVTTHYILFQLATTGKTKTVIKSVHKENVCRFLSYLRMRKVAYQYDCEWSFEGSRACQI